MIKEIFLIIIFGIMVLSCNESSSKNVIGQKNSNQIVSKKRNVETLILNFNATSCTCEQWSDTRFDKNKNSHTKDYYWLEPANEKLTDADRIFNGENLPIQIKVTGKVINEKGIPERKKLLKVNEDEAGKVFQYTQIQILKK